MTENQLRAEIVNQAKSWAFIRPAGPERSGSSPPVDSRTIRYM